AILERLTGGETLRGALEGACSKLGVPLDQSMLEGSARLLADLAERGALLGPSEIPPETASPNGAGRSGQARRA
ncbi:MAG TPA: hypothetical protein VGP93_17380, partial [Polyangiaceae bacterium]|nr:hypothetical protein [Polyangiaceae bacterium]